MKKVLITGAGGYIASVATYQLLEQGHSVIALDNFSTGYKGPLTELQKKFGSEKLIVEEVDLRKDLSNFFKKNTGIDSVLHYAASCKVDESMKEPEKYFENNVLGTLNLVRHLTEQNISRLVFSSTCAVYGEAQKIPVDESHPTNPANPYGESKLMAEKIIGWFGKVKGLQYVILRYFNVCGASDDGLIGDSKKPSVLLVQNAVRGALGIEPFFLTFPEVETPDKSPIRDYINVVDINKAHIQALDYLEKGGKNEIINLGTGTGDSVLEILDKVEKATGKTIEKKKSDKPRQGEYSKMIASIDKASKLLQWKPKRTIQQSVDSLIKWYGNHPQGWESE